MTNKTQIDGNGKFYLILSEYVGPNRRDSHGNFIAKGGVLYITTQPGRTNSSREERTDGWLGTTNDNAQYAHGEFDSLVEARAAAVELGYTEIEDSDESDGDCLDYADDNDQSIIVESRLTPAAAREQWDADDWFHLNCSHSETREAYGITADTTDAELEAAVAAAEAEAADNNAELHDTEKVFDELRDELRDALAEQYLDVFGNPITNDEEND